MKKKILLLTWPLLMVAATAAHADALVLTGYDASRWANYSYVGAIAAPDLKVPGWRARVWSEQLHYEYISDGRTIQADAQGGRLSAGYQWSHASGYTTVYAGGAWRDTQLPVGVTSDVQGNQGSLTLDLEHRQTLADGSMVDAIVSTQSRFGDYWSRLRWLRPAGDVTWGPEATLSGSMFYRAARLGIGASLPLGSRVRLEASVGSVYSNDQPDGGYAGVGLAVGF